MIEEQVINHIINDKDPSIIILNQLTEDYFPTYKAEFNFINNHIKKYNTVPDKTTFLSNFPDFDVFEVTEPVSYLTEELFAHYQTNTLVKSYNAIRQDINNDKKDEALKKLKDTYESLTSTGVSLNCVDILRDTSRYDDYVERLQDFDKYYVKTGLPELDAIIGGWDKQEELATIVARTNVGKCLAKGTEVLMADGTLKKVECVRVGDKVQSLNRTNTVLALHSGKSRGYKIIPNVGSPFTVSENHILTLMKRKGVWDRERKMSTTNHEYDLIDISIEDYLKLSKHEKNQLSLYRPGVDYGKKEQKIPAYVLGLWLGDGTSCRVELTSADSEIISVWQNWATSLQLKCRESKGSLIPSKQRESKARMFEITAGVENKGVENAALRLFREYSLLNNKHIPLNYLTGDREQRLQLLAGILDTDGYYNGRGYELTFCNKLLIQQTAQLARGLGFRVAAIRTHVVSGFTEYTINIYGPHLNDIPVILSRKKAKDPTPNALRRELNLTGFTVEEIPEVEYYGFMADGDHRYLLADNTLTHNTWLMLKFAVSAAEQGLNVGIYSGEMSEKKIGYRVDTLIQHISNGALIHGGASVQNDYKTYIENLPNRFKGSIKVLTPKMINGAAGVSALRAFIQKEKLDILFIDQHSLLEDDRGAKNPVERAANISKDLKNLQVLMRIPFIAVSQQNRTTTENGTGTEHIAQSDRIGQDSTCILFFERNDKNDKNRLTIDLVKSRDSENGKKLNYHVDFNTGTFTFIPGEDNVGSEKAKEYNREYETGGEDVF